MEEEEHMLSPFWLQSSADGGGRRRRLGRSYSLFLSSGALLAFLLVTACVFIFIVVPTLISFTSHVFKPQLVKKSWDSLNLILVVFAIVCGFLSRNNNNNNNNSNETPRSYEDRTISSQEYVKSNPETPRPWYVYSASDRAVNSSFQRLRSFNSYPDLRQESSWIAGDERWRFYDDTHLSGYRGSEFDDFRQIRHRQPKTEDEGGDDGIKNIAVDTFVVKDVPSAPPLTESPIPPSPPPSPPPQRTEGVRRNEREVRDFRRPPSKPKSLSSSSPPQVPRTKGVRRNAKRTYHASEESEMIENEENNESEVRVFHSPPPPSRPPPPPPPLPPPFSPPAAKKTDERKKKRGSATKEFLTSLTGKKKKQRQKSVENFETILNNYHASSSQRPPSTPPPPPPPPPPSVFHNLFSSRKPKHKKPHPAPSPATAPAPPVITHKPRISYKRSEIFGSLNENVITGNESPLIPIPPPPPPPPPFKMPAWRFRVQGDFVRIDSVRSSRSSSPEIDEEVESPTTNQVQELQSHQTSLLFCPSPDVDTKADTFIARFRAGLKLEKMNSMKGKSNLGPSSLSTETREEIIGPN